MRVLLFIVLVLPFALAYGNCPAGFIGKNCLISAEVGGCKNISLGELCIGLSFPDSCDVTAAVYLQGLPVLSKTMRINLLSDVCFSPQVPGVTCEACLSLKDIRKDEQGKIKTVCPEVRVKCPSQFKINQCVQPRVALSANCIKPAAPTPAPTPATGGGSGGTNGDGGTSGSTTAGCTSDADCNHGRCSFGGACVCDPNWSGPKCTEAHCVPPCGPGGSCTSANQCTCKKGWSPPYCLTQESQDSQTGGNSSGSDNGGKNVGLIVLGVIAVALLVLGGAITAYHFWKKRRENRLAGYDEMNDLIDDDDDDKLAFVRS